VTTKPLWKCPRCGREFANINQPHSCGNYTVEDFLTGKDEASIALYRRFEMLVQQCGPTIITPAKTRVGFQVRMIFAAVNKLSNGVLDGHVVLTRRLENPRFRRIESLYERSHVHHFRIRSLDEFDDEVLGWLEEAYQVGTQAQLKQRASKKRLD
jgi:hypothetical protein